MDKCRPTKPKFWGSQMHTIFKTVNDKGELIDTHTPPYYLGIGGGTNVYIKKDGKLTLYYTTCKK